MARVNITVPDDVLAAAKSAGLNISRLTALAIREELDRRDKVCALESYLREMEGDVGPIPEEEQRAARQWANETLRATAHGSRAARTA